MPYLPLLFRVVACSGHGYGGYGVLQFRPLLRRAGKIKRVQVFFQMGQFSGAGNGYDIRSLLQQPSQGNWEEVSRAASQTVAEY